jgi:hypothetical protein
MTTEKPPARGGEQRKADVLRRLAEDEDAWVSTAGGDGEPCLVPLTFVWHDETLVMTTRTTNPTAVNIARHGRATVALGHTRDVVLIEAEAEVMGGDEPRDAGEAFVAKTKWDPRGRPDWCWLRFRPRTVRAWREANELKGRYLMRDGTWLV